MSMPSNKFRHGGNGRTFSGLARGVGAVALTLIRLGEAGQMRDAVQRLNGATDAQLTAQGRTRSGEVDRIFG